MKNLIVCIVSFLIMNRYFPKRYEIINEGASLPESFGFRNMNLKAVTSSINHKKETMMTLYGNSLAVNELNGQREDNKNKERILALIVWSQKDDPYWYGAKIPGKLLSVEIIKSVHPFPKKLGIQYHRYEGRELRKVTAEGKDRINEILQLKPSIMP